MSGSVRSDGTGRQPVSGWNCWLVGVCLVAMSGAPALGAARLFMTRSGDQALVPTVGDHTIFMDPGTSVLLEVWVDNTSPQILGGYQIGLPGSATLAAGSGTLTYIDRPAPSGDSVFVDQARPEWVFASVPGASVFLSETGLPQGFGFIGFLPLGSGQVIPGLGYVGEFEFDASIDASGTFTLDFIPFGEPPNGGTGLIDETGTGAVITDFQRLVIKIGPQPANDECIDPVNVVSGDLPFQNAKSTTSMPNGNFGGPGNAVCNDNGNDLIYNDLWFTHNAQCEGVTTVSTCDQADFDTRIEIYEGCVACPPTNLIACNDDGLACGGGTSEVNFLAMAGTCYTIRVGATDPLGLGSGTLSITANSCFIGGVCYDAFQNNPLNECEACIPSLATSTWSSQLAGVPCTDDSNDCTSDQCDGAGVCEHPPTTAGTACPDDGEVCTADQCDGAATCIHPPVPSGAPCPDDGDICTIDQCDGAGACGHPPAPSGTPCPDDADVCTIDECDGAGVCAHPAGPAGVACDDGLACTGTGQPGVGVDACDDAGNCVGMLDPNCSDNCADAAVAFEGVNVGNNTGFGTEITASCALSAHDAWFVHAARCDGLIKFNTIGSAIDTVLTLYDGCGGLELGCDDDGAPGADATLTIPVIAGQHYYARVAGFNGAQGGIVLNITRLDACFVDGACRAPGEANPVNQCQLCMPVFDTENWWPRPKGTACGNPTPTNAECDAADACDGTGFCEENNKPRGLACGDPTDTECDNPDVCDGLGACGNAFEPSGFACGVPDDTECDNPDTCDGTGNCLDNFEIPGFACGSAANTNCDNPDTCDGAGLCLINFEPGGTACPNGVFCDGAETCVDGICIDNTDPCIDDPHCDEANAVCLECLNVNECADLDMNGVVDDGCIWYDCVTNACLQVPRIFGDIGGAFGDCVPDGFANLADALLALNCFSQTGACEVINSDIGGAFGSCAPDGFCNLADALLALEAFASTTSCACPLDGGPAPEFMPNTVATTRLVAVPETRLVRPGDEIDVRVFIDGSLKDLRGYQLDTTVSGGRRGQLELVAIVIEARADYVFQGIAQTFDAFNTGNGRMLNALFAANGVETAGGYLATYHYRVSQDAVGTFVIDVASAGQTFMTASNNGKIDVLSTLPGIVVVTPGSSRAIR